MKGKDRLWLWFGLSKASILTIPRSLMHEMPDEWQDKMAELLEEYEDTFDTSEIGIDSVHVQARKDGKFTSIPEFITNYRHPDKAALKALRIKK